MAGGPNAEQREYWNGDESREWVVEPARFDEMLAPFGALVLERALLRPGERVVDVGCGNGATTIDAARAVAPDGSVVGIDLSRAMLDTARSRAEQARVDNVEFVADDAQVADLGSSLDAVISRFGVMFFDDPDAAFSNMAGALAPGGRVAFACWCPAGENEWIAVPMAAAYAVVSPAESGLPGPDEPGPFRYGEPTPLVAALERAGLVDVAAERVEAPILLGGRGTLEDVRTFLEHSGMTRSLLGAASPDERARALDAIADALEPHVTDSGVLLGATGWIVTARKP